MPGDLAEASAAATTGIGRIELDAVKGIEELSAELKVHSAFWRQFKVLEDTEVEILHAVIAQIRFRPRVVAIPVVVGTTRRKGSGIEPVSQPGVERAAGHLFGSDSGRQSTADIRNAGVAKCPRAAPDDNGEAALEGDDRIDSPSANHRILDGIHVGHEPPALCRPANRERKR